RSEKYIDRRGRFIGNLIGVGDVVSGRRRPERAAELKCVVLFAPLAHQKNISFRAKPRAQGMRIRS
ncbi:MAG: hypothetical protein QOF32_685, partial [Gammaproteobacteria bacterium]|nr:hypothetical protein [Gammaproteobacteria bacterium]